MHHECVICLEFIEDQVLYPFCDVRHKLHSRCAETHVNTEIVQRHLLPRCPICRKLMFETPFVAIFETKWGYSSENKSIIACDYSKVYPPDGSFYILGPFPWRGSRYEFSHLQLRDKFGPLGCEFYVDFDEAQAEYHDSLMALYVLFPVDGIVSKFSLIGIGDKIFDMNTSLLININQLK